MKQAEIATEWVGNGTVDNPFRPQLADDYALLSWHDATGQAASALPGDPNLFNIVVLVDEDVLNSIEADSNYNVLWRPGRRGPKNAPPSRNEWGQLRAFLARKGMSQAQIVAAIGDDINERSRGEIAATLTTWLKERNAVN